MTLIDLHQDTPRLTVDPGVDLVAGAAAAHVDLPRLEAGGALAVVWAACEEGRLAPAESAALVTRMIAGARDQITRSAGRLRLVSSAADLDACAAGGPIGVVLALEGAHSLLGSLAMLEALHALGLRVLVVTWNHRNPFAAGCRDTVDGGLTPLGRELILRASELGILIDLAHASPRTLAAGAALLDRPFMVSHTACAALHAHVRNLSDAQLRTVAERGGVVGIMLYPPFLAGPEARVDAATVAAHVRHALDVAGEEAVAIGTDLDGMNRLPMDLSGLQDLPRLVAALGAAGLSAAAIEKVTWRNAARVLRAGLREG
jgi:membrane dipeptidase